MSKNKKRQRVSIEHSCQIRGAYQLCGVRGKDLLRMFPQYSKVTVYNHAEKPINGKAVADKRKNNPGRRSKLSQQDIRKINRTIRTLRKSEGSFTSQRVQEESGILHVSNRTIRRTLNTAGYHYLQSRKKGLLTENDLRTRMQFCRKVRSRKLYKQFWREGISLYLDGKGFEFKTNPLGQARAPASREWRRRGEGLSIGCVAKGKKEGSVNANFMVAISYGAGAVLCSQYFGPITGEKFANIVRNDLPQAFASSSNPRVKRMLMDGCPRQNCRVALDTIQNVGGLVFSIPPRSPDINPIENFFHLVSKQLRRQAIQRNITRESFVQFSDRVRDVVLNYPVAVIDNIIDSMEKRVAMIVRAKGQRIKY